MPSFLNADDIIEISEKRLDQYTQSYQKITDKFTNIFVIYSAISIFLIPCINTLFFYYGPVVGVLRLFLPVFHPVSYLCIFYNFTSYSG